MSQENIEFVRRVYEAASRVTLKRDGVMLTQISSSRVSPRIVLYDVVSFAVAGPPGRGLRAIEEQALEVTQPEAWPRQAAAAPIRWS